MWNLVLYWTAYIVIVGVLLVILLAVESFRGKPKEGGDADNQHQMS